MSTMNMDSSIGIPDRSAVFSGPPSLSLASALLVIQSYWLYVTGNTSYPGLFPFFSKFLITEQEKLVLDPVDIFFV